MLESFAMTKGEPNPGSRLELLQGTLDLMVLQTLDTMGPLHGYGIARRIEQMSDAILKLNEGTVYAALMRSAHAEAYERWLLRQQQSALDIAVCRHDELPMVGTVDLTNQLPFLELTA